MFILSILAWSAFFYGWDITIFGTIMSTFYQSLGSFIPVQIAITLFSQVYIAYISSIIIKLNKNIFF